MKVGSLTELLTGQILDVSRFRYVSLDFFNTVAVRRVSELEIRKMAWQGFSSVSPDKLPSFETFEHTRSEVIAELGLSVHDYGAEILTDFCSLYQQVLGRLGVVDPDDACTRFCRVLIDQEIDNLVVNKDLQPFARALQSKGVSLLVVSDTGYGRTAVKVILAGLGIYDLFDGLFVSCQGLGTKFTGDLYLGVIRHLELTPGELLHVGDNVVSDYTRAEEAGVTAILLRRDPSLFPDVSQSLDAFKALDITAVASLIYLFCRWIRDKTPDQTGLVFMGRDAYLLYMAYSMLYPEDAVRYGYLNRVTANLFRDIGSLEEGLGFVDSVARSQGVYGIVRQFGLRDTRFSDDLTAFCHQHGIAIDGLLDQETVNRLTSDKDLSSSFIEARDSHRNHVMKYVDHLTAPWSEVYLVDIGWQGSVFRALKDDLHKIRRCLLLYSVQHVPGVMSPLPIAPGNAHAVSSVYQRKELIEWLFREDRGSFSHIANECAPIFDDVVSEDVQKGIFIRRVLAEVRSIASVGSEMTLQKACEGTLEVLQEVESKLNANEEGARGISGPENAEVFTSGRTHSERNLSAAAEDEAHAFAVQTSIYHFLALKNKLNSRDNVVLYGAGSGCEFLLPHLRPENISGIVDINPALQGKKVWDIGIKPLSFLDTFTGTVCVTVIGRRQQIQTLLERSAAELVFLEDYLQG